MDRGVRKRKDKWGNVELRRLDSEEKTDKAIVSFYDEEICAAE